MAVISRIERGERAIPADSDLSKGGVEATGVACGWVSTKGSNLAEPFRLFEKTCESTMG